jgi:hypothetical protein
MAMMVPLAPLPLADFNQYWPQPEARAVQQSTSSQRQQSVGQAMPNTNDSYLNAHQAEVFKLKSPKPVVSNMGKSLDVMA